MKSLAGLAMCAAGGNMIAHDFVLAGLAILIAGFAQLLTRETNNA